MISRANNVERRTGQKASPAVFFCSLVFFLGFLGMPQEASAQRPKMHLKGYVGLYNSYFVVRDTTNYTDHLVGYLGGFGFRVTSKRWFGEADFDFVRTGLTVPLQDVGINDELLARFYSFQLPLTAGYVMVKEPIFKWYAYTGPVNRINTRGQIELFGETVSFTNREVGLRSYNLDWRLGTQFDIAMFNIDFSYSIGVTNSLSENQRTNFHAYRLLVGLLF
jgi:hypothetical protein